MSAYIEFHSCSIASSSASGTGVPSAVYSRQLWRIACIRVRLCLARAATGLPVTPVTTYMVKGGRIGGFGGG
jgi:hypothetical protein